MSGAVDIIRNGRSQSDFDGQGHKLVNWDTSNLILGEFGVQAANTVYAGPASGAPAIPTFRLLTPVQIGAQPHSDGLDILSPLTPTALGTQFLEAPVPNSTRFPKIIAPDFLGNSLLFITPTEMRTEIQAQPLSANLTKVAGVVPSDTGLNFLDLIDPVQAGYPKIGNDVNHTITVLTPAQLLADIGAGTGGAGGTGTGDPLAITVQGVTTLDPGSPYIQWTQPVTIAGTDYVHELIISRDDAAKGAIFNIILDFLQDATAEITIWDGADDPDTLQIFDIYGQADAPTRYVFKAYFDGNNWKRLEGYYT